MAGGTYRLLGISIKRFFFSSPLLPSSRLKKWHGVHGRFERCLRRDSNSGCRQQGLDSDCSAKNSSQHASSGTNGNSTSRSLELAKVEMQAKADWKNRTYQKTYRHRTIQSVCHLRLYNEGTASHLILVSHLFLIFCPVLKHLRGRQTRQTFFY